MIVNILVDAHGASDFKKELTCRAYITSMDGFGITVYLYDPLNDEFKLLYGSHSLGWELELR